MPYPDDPQLKREVLDLYETAWPGIAPRIRFAGELGSDWYDMSTPVVVRDGKCLVAHVGITEVELLLLGQRRSVAAVHAVCVRPDWQGKGLGREIMELALARIDAADHPTTILWSEKSEFYAKFGFARAAEPVFVGEAPLPQPTPARGLDLSRPADRRRLVARLASRRPVSNVAAAADRGWHFLIDFALWPDAAAKLVDLPEDDAIVVADVQADELHLYDVLADSMPPVARILGAVAGDRAPGVRTVVSYLTPDRLDVRLAPQAHRMEDWLHVRGAPLLASLKGSESPAFALSPLTRT